MIISLFTIVIQLFFCFSVSSQTASSNRFKRIDYEYDLVSGKVNKVSYQKDSADQFIHQYSYDSDNRITKVETSSDNVVWDVDAKYFYYAHGPLARTEIGNDKVQGIDYAYTLQGWIKGVNSNTLDKKRDMGQDGKDTSIYDPSNPQLHANFAQDAFGYSLNYFKGDYKAINQVRWNNTTNRFEAVTTGSELMQQTHDLYNGNIKSMVNTITQIDTTSAGNVNPQIPKPLGNAYRYDQLNRIKKSVSYTNIDLIGNLWQSSGQTIANMYGNTFSYDANGNILTQNRSDENGQEFEALNYKYRTLAGNLRQNRLYHVNDNISYTSLKTDDIDDQGHFANGASSSPLIDSVGQFNNYSYDNIGNLVKDKAEQIASIEWTVYGKVKKITRSSGSTRDNIIFDYDPMGNRIAKHVYDNANNWKYTTYYVRDAQGNIMATYEHKNIPPTGGIGSPSMSFVLQEQHLYGSSRLGMYVPNKELIFSNNASNNISAKYLGEKTFELTNHLDNVLSVVSDRKIKLDINSDGIIDFYQPDILQTNDYSVYGAKLNGRGFDFNNYRFSMNGQENIAELGKNHNTAMFWEYDSRLAMRWNLDPENVAFWSPYGVFYGMPVKLSDPNGDCPWLLVVALVMTADVLVAPTNHPEIDAPAIKEARRNHDIGIVTNLAAPGIGAVAEKYVIKKVLVKSTPVIVKKTEQEIIKQTEKQIVKQTEKKAVEVAEKQTGKIVTSGVQHGTKQHWNTMNKVATELAKEGQTVYLNKALNTALGKTIEGVGKWKPDIVSISKNGVINLTEVISPSQTAKEIWQKMTTMATALERQGYKVTKQVLTEGGKSVKQP